MHAAHAHPALLLPVFSPPLTAWKQASFKASHPSFSVLSRPLWGCHLWTDGVMQLWKLQGPFRNSWAIMGLFSSAEGEEVGVRVCSCSLQLGGEKKASAECVWQLQSYHSAWSSEGKCEAALLLAITHWTILNELTLKNSEVTRIYDSCTIEVNYIKRRLLISFFSTHTHHTLTHAYTRLYSSNVPFLSPLPISI